MLRLSSRLSCEKQILPKILEFVSSKPVWDTSAVKNYPMNTMKYFMVKQTNIRRLAAPWSSISSRNYSEIHHISLFLPPPGGTYGLMVRCLFFLCLLWSFCSSKHLTSLYNFLAAFLPSAPQKGKLNEAPAPLRPWIGKELRRTCHCGLVFIFISIVFTLQTFSLTLSTSNTLTSISARWS